MATLDHRLEVLESQQALRTLALRSILEGNWEDAAGAVVALHGGGPLPDFHPRPFPRHAQIGDLRVVDIRNELPRAHPENLAYRPLQQVTLCVFHWDGGHQIADNYDPVEYYKAEARYHIQKNWAKEGKPPSYGHGLMYHAKLARDGTLYLTRKLEEEVWAAMGANPIGAMVCVDATYGQGMTPAQRKALPLVEMYMSRQVGRALHVTGHGLLPPEYGNQTDCPGPEIRDYLASRSR